MPIKMDFDYSVQFGDRKTFGLVIERDKSILVKVPKNAKKEKIDEFVNENKYWIYKKLKSKQKYKDIPEKEFVSGSSILYLGRNYNLDIGSYNHEGIKFDGKFLLSEKERENANKLFKKWFIQKSEEKIYPLIEFHAKNLGVEFNNVGIKDFKYRWASCTPNNNLYFNWRLIKAPLSVINYVIIHELAHLLETNHTKRFWNIVKAQMPKYEEARNWLKDNGQVLEIEFESNQTRV